MERLASHVWGGGGGFGGRRIPERCGWAYTWVEDSFPSFGTNFIETHIIPIANCIQQPNSPTGGVNLIVRKYILKPFKPGKLWPMAISSIVIDGE